MTCEDKIRSDNMIEFYFSIQHALSHVIDDRTTNCWSLKISIDVIFYYLTNLLRLYNYLVSLGNRF